LIKPGGGKPVITPEEWIREWGQDLGAGYDAAILTFWGSPLEILEESLTATSEIRLRGMPVIRAIEGRGEGLRVLVAQSYFGAPAAVTALELLIASGIRRFLVYGGAGSITHRLRIGDVLIPTWGVREEGTSYHYMPEEYVPKPSRHLASRLRRAMFSTLTLHGSRVMEGGVWSTDAIFRETEDKALRYANEGVLGVDMESTALMTVAEYRGVELAIALVITDELTPPEWRTPSRKEWDRIEDKEERILKAMLNTLHS